MEEKFIKPSTVVLQVLITVFSVCFIYFTFVAYPKIVNEKRFAINLHPFAREVVANAESFPIKTATYRITHEADSGLYYIIIEGKTIDTYVQNKSAAQLTLKNTLSVESLCKQKIIYASAAQLELPSDYKTTSNCD